MVATRQHLIACATTRKGQRAIGLFLPRATRPLHVHLLPTVAGLGLGAGAALAWAHVAFHLAFVRCVSARKRLAADVVARPIFLGLSTSELELGLSTRAEHLGPQRGARRAHARVALAQARVRAIRLSSLLAADLAAGVRGQKGVVFGVLHLAAVAVVRGRGLVVLEHTTRARPVDFIAAAVLFLGVVPLLRAHLMHHQEAPRTAPHFPSSPNRLAADHTLVFLRFQSSNDLLCLRRVLKLFLATF